MSSAPSSTKVKTATNTEMARTYISRHYEDTIFARGQWNKYQNGVWVPHHDMAMSQEIWETLEEFEGKGQCRPTQGGFTAVWNRTKARLFVPEEMMDGYQNLANLENGVYDMETSSLLPHSEKYYFTTQLPFCYDPAAECPMWHYYLMTTLVHPETNDTDIELIEFIQEAMGYSFTTDICHHVTFWCYGGGSNGKGVLFHVLEKLAGSAYFPLNIGMLKRNTYQLAELAGKRIAACSEAAATDNLVEDAQIKALIGGDTMTARSPYARPFALHPTVKLWWSMNNLPAVADYSEGFWRRVRVIPFNKEFKGKRRILDLKEKLNAELPGIFNWAMEGLRRLRSSGQFSEPQQVLEVTRQYRHESNPSAMFIEEKCKEENNIKLCSPVTAVYQAYKNWCHDSNYKPHASRRFRREMERMGYFSKKKNPPIDKTLVYEGIKIMSLL